MNVTLQIDHDVLARARVRALQRGTSVNALVRSYRGVRLRHTPGRLVLTVNTGAPS